MKSVKVVGKTTHSSYILSDGKKTFEMPVQEFKDAVMNGAMLAPTVEINYGGRSVHIHPELEYPLEEYVNKFLKKVQKVVTELGGFSTLATGAKGTTRFVTYFPEKHASVIVTITKDEKFYIQISLSPAASVPIFTVHYVRTTKGFPIYRLPEKVTSFIKTLTKVYQSPQSVDALGSSRKILVYK